MPVVARVLLDHVAEDPTEARRPAVGPGTLGQAGKPGHRRAPLRARHAPAPRSPARSRSSSSGVLSTAECHSQSGSASQSTPAQRASGSRPCSHCENFESSTRARCLSIPPRVIVETPTLVFRPVASSPRHFHANVARWYSRNPTRVSASSSRDRGLRTSVIVDDRHEGESMGDAPGVVLHRTCTAYPHGESNPGYHLERVVS